MLPSLSTATPLGDCRSATACGPTSTCHGELVTTTAVGPATPGVGVPMSGGGSASLLLRHLAKVRQRHLRHARRRTHGARSCRRTAATPPAATVEADFEGEVTTSATTPAIARISTTAPTIIGGVMRDCCRAARAAARFVRGVISSWHVSETALTSWSWRKRKRAGPIPRRSPRSIDSTSSEVIFSARPARTR